MLVHIHKKYLMRMHLIFALVLIMSSSSIAQQNNPALAGQYSVLPESKLWFEGASTLHDYSVNANIINGTIMISQMQNPSPLTVSSDTFVKNVFNFAFENTRITLPVKELKSAHEGLDKKMYETMNAEKYPEITFVLSEKFSVTLNPDTSFSVEKQIAGELTVAGKTQIIEIPVKAYFLPENKIRITGSKELLMSSFGMKKPTFLIVFRTADEVKVYFDIYLKQVH